MDDLKAMDKMDKWEVNGEETIENALKATMNKWNDIQEMVDDVSETIKVICGMCKYANCGECDICIMSDASLQLCSIDDETYSLYNDIKKAANILSERVSEMVYALQQLSYSDAYKDALRYEAIQQGK